MCGTVRTTGYNEDYTIPYDSYIDCGINCESWDADWNQIENCKACIDVGGSLNECRRHLDSYTGEAPMMVNLPPLAADPDSVILTGFSSGADMSHQLHIINSATIKGVGSMNGNAFYSKAWGNVGIPLPRNWA